MGVTVVYFFGAKGGVDNLMVKSLSGHIRQSRPVKARFWPDSGLGFQGKVLNCGESYLLPFPSKTLIGSCPFRGTISVTCLGVSASRKLKSTVNFVGKGWKRVIEILEYSRTF